MTVSFKLHVLMYHVYHFLQFNLVNDCIIGLCRLLPFLKSLRMFQWPFPFLFFSFVLLSILRYCLNHRSLTFRAAPMLRQAAPPTLEAVNICRLHAPPALSAVDIGPAILARTRGTRVTVDIGHVSPDPTLVTPIILLSRQLEGGQRNVREYPNNMKRNQTTEPRYLFPHLTGLPCFLALSVCPYCV